MKNSFGGKKIARLKSNELKIISKGLLHHLEHKLDEIEKKQKVKIFDNEEKER